MSEQREQPPEPSPEAPESSRGRHPAEEGEASEGPAVPEDEEVVPNRHSASAEAAWLRWRETHEDD